MQATGWPIHEQESNRVWDSMCRRTAVDMLCELRNGRWRDSTDEKNGPGSVVDKHKRRDEQHRTSEGLVTHGLFRQLTGDHTTNFELTHHRSAHESSVDGESVVTFVSKVG